MFTSRRDGRRSLPLRANVRVGPPAMSSSIRSFLRQHFCGSLLSEVFTPRRFGRRSLPLRANVRVGPPAMSSSVRSFLRQHFCGSIYKDTMKTEIALAPKTSQRPTEGAFFSSESAEKNRTGWAAKACLHDSANTIQHGQSVTPIRVKCSRHAGTVAAHCRYAPMFASARPPCRHPIAVFSVSISAFR